MTAPAPLRRWGQHFLHDENALQRIVEAIDPRPGQHLVEIGPGTGALTRLLLQRDIRVTALEIDSRMAPLLRQLGDKRLQLWLGDVMRFDFSTIEGPFRLVGNLPYNISTALLRRLWRCQGDIEDMYFLLQQEVVQRLCAVPKDPHYGFLSVLAACHSRPRCLFSLPPEVFLPPPKVYSALLCLVPKTPPVAMEQLERVLSVAFAQRRKTLRRALSGLLTAAEIESCGIDSSQRAEQLAVADFERLSACCDRKLLKKNIP